MRGVRDLEGSPARLPGSGPVGGALGGLALAPATPQGAAAWHLKAPPTEGALAGCQRSPPASWAPRPRWSRGICWKCWPRSQDTKRGVPLCWVLTSHPRGGVGGSDSSRRWRPGGCGGRRGPAWVPCRRGAQGQAGGQDGRQLGACLPPSGTTTQMSCNLHDKVAPLLGADRMPAGAISENYLNNVMS